MRPHYRLGYADADHGKGDGQPDFYVRYTDKITHHNIAFQDEDIDYSWPMYFHNTDAMLINGNHFVGDQQVVLIHPKKKESLERKLDRLTDVKMIILAEGVDEPWEFLKEHMEYIDKVPVVRREEVSLVSRMIREEILGSRPVVKGLVLAGGQSVRMGRDKGSIDYHGMPQREYAAGLLSKVCKEVLISARPGMEFDS
ncbi:MAG: NTP transferase domain-containing protein, partial [Cyclobacteriaceae bacterium]